MAWLIIILAAGTMLALALFMAYVLGWANHAFHIEVNPQVEAVLAALPGANCGGCGFIGCAEYAEAVVATRAPVDKCTVGGASCAKLVGEILGVEVAESYPYRPAVHCAARLDDRLQRQAYHGEQTCAAANLIAGVQGCTYGCLGLDDCVGACRFDAIHVVDGLARVDYQKCVGCGACEKACPRHIISMVPFKAEQMLVVACSNKDFGKDVKAVCKVGCIGCKACQRASELFKVEDNLAQIDYEKYDPTNPAQLLAALEKCPMKGLVWMGKPTDADLAAVAGEEMPAAVRDQFETSVDKTEWRG